MRRLVVGRWVDQFDFVVRNQEWKLEDLLSVDSQALDDIGIGNHIRCSHLVLLECLLTEELALFQCPDEGLRMMVTVGHGDLNFALVYDVESVTFGTLSYYVVAFLEVGLFW